MLSELVIENYKCLDRARIPLKPLTLLAGLNGMGKSSAIQALLLLHQSHQMSPDGSVGRLVLNGPLIDIGTARDALWEGAQKELVSLGFICNDKEYVWNFSYQESDDELNGLPQNPTSIPTGHGVFTDDFYYLRAERLGPKASFPISNTAVKYRHQIGRDGEFAPFFLSTYGSEELSNSSLLHQSAASKQLRHQLEAWLGEVSPGARVYTESHTKLDLVSLEFAFSSQLGETKHFRATNVGFGISYTMPILLAILAARPGTMILLENPEAHLHPRGQVMMGQLLGLATLGGVQVIVETHSDHLLNGVRLVVHDGRITHESVGLSFFERINKEGSISASITIPILDRAGRISEWPDGFFDESEKVLRKLLIPPKE